MCDSCHQLSKAVNSCWQLIKMKINLESWNLAHPSTLVFTRKFQLNFFHISHHQLSAAVNSCQQLITVNENENQPRGLKFGKDITNRVYMNIPVSFFSYHLSSAVNSFQQLITGGNSWWKWESTRRAEILHIYKLYCAHENSS